MQKELLSKDTIIDILIPIFKKYNIDEKVQEELVNCIINQSNDYNIENLILELSKIKGHFGYFGSEEQEYVPYGEMVDIIRRF